MTKKTAIILSFLALSWLASSATVPGREFAPSPGTKPTAISPQAADRFARQMDTGPDDGRMPVYFIPNRGQLDPQASFYIQGRDKTLYFSPGGITISLNQRFGAGPQSPGAAAPGQGVAAEGSDLFKMDLVDKQDPLPGNRPVRGPAGDDRWTIKLDFVDANPRVQPEAESKTGAVVSYFKGKKDDWRTGLPTYSRIAYRNLWPGIDLVYYGTANRLKYEFIVQPGAHPSAIRLAYRGIDGLSVDGQGRLRISTPAGTLEDDVPIAYQEKNGIRVDVPLAYRLGESGQDRMTGQPGSGVTAKPYRYCFNVGDYDRTLPLILDPAILVYCGFVGGSGEDYARAIALDKQGNSYIVGNTSSREASFPVVVGPDLTHNTGSFFEDDAFIAKISATGDSLVYCGYIGGADNDMGHGLAVDEGGCAYVTGTTWSPETSFPVLVGPDLTLSGGSGPDAFVAKVNPLGTSLLFCGYIGGSGGDQGHGLALDAKGNAYIAGRTSSPDLPTSVGPDLTANGDTDAFVAKVNAEGTSLVYCGYLGGSALDAALGIAVDRTGCAYVAGFTLSPQSTFPVAVGPFLNYGGKKDAFVAKVNALGSALDYCGYLGGMEQDQANGIAVDRFGCAYVAGLTSSQDFPVVVGPDLTYHSWDAFVVKVSPQGTALAYSGFIGGAQGDEGLAVAVDSFGNCYVTGDTASDESSFPLLVGPGLSFNKGTSGGTPRDAFVARVNARGTKLDYCGYIGGSGEEDIGTGIAVDGFGNAYVSGYTRSMSEFPVIAGPDSTFNGATYDGFVAKVAYFNYPIHQDAVGDFEGDEADELAIDLDTNGAWIYDKGAWLQVTAADPGNMISLDIDADDVKEIALDLDAWGVWLWDFGVWIPVDPNDPEYLIAADTDGNGKDEIFLDRGARGLWWRPESGVAALISGLNPEDLISVEADGDGSQEVAADFGATGLWLWDGGNWTELTGADAQTMIGTDVDGNGTEEITAGLGAWGMWLWSGGNWSQLSGISPNHLAAAGRDGWGEALVGNFGGLGVWSWGFGVWGQLSIENAEGIAAADTNGDGADEVAADLGPLGFWLCDNGTWTQLSGDDPGSVLAADTDGDGAQELIVDFGAEGFWVWNRGQWAQIRSDHPD